MARIQVILAFSLLLAVITYHDHIILYTEGRPMISMSKVSQRSDQYLSAPPPRGREPTPGGVEISVAAGKKELPPSMMMPNYSVGFGDSTAVYDNDFQPTPPGHSPGVGHHFVTTEDHELSNSHSVKQSVTANKDDYRPTEPGHSPGVGHSLQKTNAEPNASYIHA